MLRLALLDALLSRLRLVAVAAMDALVSLTARLLLTARLIRRGRLTTCLIRRRLLGSSLLAARLAVLIARLALLADWPSAGLPTLLPAGLGWGGLLGGGAASVRGGVHRVLRLSR